MRRSRILPAFIAVAAVVLAIQVASGTGVDKQAMTFEQAARGEGVELYAEACASCHGTDGRGDGPAAPALATPVPDLTQLALRHEGAFPADAVRRAITGEATIPAHGNREMPVWGKVFQEIRPDWKPARRSGFSRQRIDVLTEYLRTIQAGGEN